MLHNPSVQPVEKRYFLAILALLIIPISGLSIDIYVPSLPAVSQYFNVDKSSVQLSITTYMIGLGLLQLFAGSISDSFGRRQPFIIAMIIYIICTLLVPQSINIQQLLLLRFIQGSAVALCIVPMRSVFIDLFQGNELYKMMNYMTMAWSIGPIIAPAIGGYLQHYFGWKANFYFLAIYSSITFILIFLFVPETSQHRHSFHPYEIFQRYLQIIFHWKYFSGLLIDSLLYSIIILFGIVAPFLIQTVLHYTPVEFGHMTLMMGLAWFLGSMTCRCILHYEFDNKIKICLWLTFLISLAMLIVAYLTPLNIYNIMIPIFALLWVGGTVFPNYFARSLSLFPKISGSANALFGSSVFFIAGIISIFGTFLKSNSEIPLAIAYVILTLLCLIIFYLSLIPKNSSNS